MGKGHQRIDLPELEPLFPRKKNPFERIYIVACGTSYHAGMVGKYMMESMARIPVIVDLASEFRYRQPVLDSRCLMVVISQSGETADTLAVVQMARQKKAKIVSICNVMDSSIPRISEATLYTHAGPEIGVASTKAYLAQLTVLALFALYFGKLRGKLSGGQIRESIGWLLKLPRQIEETLRQDKAVKQCARELYTKRNFLYLGRGYNFPNALEGALKLKEITYAHAHGYAAGEMKHGPIALIDSEQPVICISPASKTYEKMISNIQEIKARKGIVVSVATAGDQTIKKLSRFLFSIPETKEMLSSILAVIPLQLFAYYVAVFNKRDVDQPRNLAKSVTVE